MTDLTGSSPGVQTPVETTSKCWKAIRVPLYAVLTILSAALQSVSFKKAGYSLMSFPYIILLVVAFSFIPILFLFVFYIDKTYGILKESKTVEVKKTFAVLGFLNALNGVLIIFSNPHVSGIVQSALAQAVIPTTLVLSVLILKVSFSKFQYIGAFVVFVGIFVEFIPYLQTSAQQSSTVASNPFFVLTFCLGQLPASLSGIYQEIAFSKSRVNVVYMMAYSSLAQFIFLVVLAPVNFIPYFGNSTPQEFLQMFKNAFLCVANDYDGHSECQNAGLILACCIFSMLLTQIFQTLLVKVSSAATSVLVMTLITPVSSFAFTFHFLMGEHVEQISVVQTLALVILLIGIALYRFSDGLVEEFTSKSVQEDPQEKKSKLNNSAVAAVPNVKILEEGKGNKQNGDGILSGSGRRASSKPVLLPTRCGIINSEYTAGGFKKFDDWEGSIFIEATEYEYSLDFTSHSLEDRGSTPLLHAQHSKMLSRSYDGM